MPDTSLVRTRGFAALKRTIAPVDLYDNKLRSLAAALGPMYLRVSGTWANSTGGFAVLVVNPGESASSVDLPLDGDNS